MEKKTIKKSLITAIVLFLIVIAFLGYFIIFGLNKKDNDSNTNAVINANTVEDTTTGKEVDEKVKYSEDITVVASLEDEVTTNSAWCGTFQLVWNDMVNNLVKQDVKFISGDNLEIVQKIADNLNKQTFTESDLSEKDFYKTCDKMSLDLKAKIEKAIKEKFNETSDVLDDIQWSNDPNCWVFYTMLKKVFNFENNFDDLENDMFASKYKDIKYFGINEKSNSKLYSQVDILYYNSNSDFAVVLNTKEQEQVMLARGLEGNTFSSLYNNLIKKSKDYSGKKQFTKNDTLKVPNIKLNIKKDYGDLCNKKFFTKEEEIYYISNAIQTIQLDLDKSGGKIKSEAIIVTNEATAIATDPVEKRHFNFDDEFVMFFKEKDKNLPYFAANIQDITLFQ